MFNAKWAVLGTAAVLAFSSQLSAVTYPISDTYQATYFYNVGFPLGPGLFTDATVTILDPGANGATNMCANIYVLNPSEEMEACCSVPLTPDEIKTTTVRSLVKNLLNGNTLNNGVIKIISSVATAANCPTGPATLTPAPDLRAWITRVDVAFLAAFGVTTTDFAQAPLSSAEEQTLVNTCHEITLIGSGFGICPRPIEPPCGPFGNGGNGNLSHLGNCSNTPGE